MTSTSDPERSRATKSPTNRAISQDRRRAQRSRRLPEGTRCICGETDPQVLVESRLSILDEHHILTRGVDPNETVWLCRNCHVRVTNGQRDRGVFDLPVGPTLLDVLGPALASMAALFDQLARICQDLADKVNSLITSLDAKDPMWRSAWGLL